MRPDREKDALRESLRNARSTLSASRWRLDDESRTQAVLTALGDAHAVVACYASVPGEPRTAELIDALVASGRRVLLPVLRRHPDWAWFSGWSHTSPAWRGIPQPTGEPLGAVALGLADLVVAPCLAATPQGDRLGTGGGWYDRALSHLRPGVPVWALARAEEVLDHVPTEPHDVAVDAVITEAGWMGTAAG